MENYHKILSSKSEFNQVATDQKITALERLLSTFQIETQVSLLLTKTITFLFNKNKLKELANIHRESSNQIITDFERAVTTSNKELKLAVGKVFLKFVNKCLNILNRLAI